jgi:hypothetical protein
MMWRPGIGVLLRWETQAQIQGLGGRIEGDMWTSKTKVEGSLILACCDETVKFFEALVGRSKGNRKGRGLDSMGGALGESRILEAEFGIDPGTQGERRACSMMSIV